MPVFSHCINTTDCIVYIGDKKAYTTYHFPLFCIALFPFVYVCIMHVITPRRSQDAPPDRAFIWRNIKSLQTNNTRPAHFKKCMSLEAVHVWQSETLRDGECGLCDTARVFPPCPSQLKKWAAIGQLSCRDACQAYRSVTNQAEKLQQEHLSLFSLLSLTRITRGDWGAKNSTNLHFLFCLASTSDFFSSSPLIPEKSYMSVFCKMWNFF